MEDVIIRIDGKEFNAEFDRREESLIKINGVQHHIELLKKISSNVFSFAVDQKLMIAEFDLDESHKVNINVDGFNFDVSITDETRKLVEKFIKQAGALGIDGAAAINAPMPGMVVKILVEAGQEVKKGEKIIIVEAMKMENALATQIDGVIKSIKVKEGQPVDKDVLMIEIEPSAA